MHGALAYNAASVIGTGLGTIFRFYAYRKWVFLDPAVQAATAPSTLAGAPMVPDYPPWELDPAFLTPAAAPQSPVRQDPVPTPAAASGGSSPWDQAPAAWDQAPAGQPAVAAGQPAAPPWSPVLAAPVSEDARLTAPLTPYRPTAPLASYRQAEPTRPAAAARPAAAGRPAEPTRPAAAAGPRPAGRHRKS
jgi:hypothetical protein